MIEARSTPSRLRAISLRRWLPAVSRSPLTTLLGLIAAVILQLFSYIPFKIDSLYLNDMEDTFVHHPE